MKLQTPPPISPESRTSPIFTIEVAPKLTHGMAKPTQSVDQPTHGAAELTHSQHIACVTYNGITNIVFAHLPTKK